MPLKTNQVVWGRKQVVLQTCPKSFITAQSLAWLEEFIVRRRLGFVWEEDFSARETEAFLILQREWEAEEENG